MRKISTSALILVALFALFGTAMPTFAHSVGQSKTHYAHTYFILVKGKVGVNPNQFGAPQLRKAYGVDQLSQQGAGITIAIIDACGNTRANHDLKVYSNAYGLPHTHVTIVKPQGQPCSDPQGWGLETDLDLEMAHAFAPQANLVLEEARDNSYNNLLGAAQDAYTNHGATVVSMSFGGGEFGGETGFDGIFSTGNARGVSFTASSGDSGCGAQYPAASPDVTSVGGTSLFLNGGNYGSESAWGGSGGGLSAIESRPSYQNGFNNHAQRGIPDVSMVSDPNTGVEMYDSQVGGWFGVGGTSVAAPLWAGVLADANSGRSNTMKNADNELYSVASDPSKYASDYHDITNGGSGGNCNAKKGYDLVTGLGTDVANTLVPDLIAAP